MTQTSRMWVKREINVENRIMDNSRRFSVVDPTPQLQSEERCVVSLLHSSNVFIAIIIIISTHHHPGGRLQ
ncbi:hypothetical protein SRHO_G00023350 [Serrasalmus rhombeus]